MKSRRIALFNGACGTADRVVIRGQVADVTLSAAPPESWDPILALPRDQVRMVRPLADFGLPGVRKPRLILEIIDHPGRNATRDDLENSRIVYRSGPITGHHNSFFTHRLDYKIPAGHYTVRAISLGNESFRQRMLDLGHRAIEERYLRRKGSVIGYGKIRILPDEYDHEIITSDIDQTFLDTDITTKKGLLQTLFEVPSQKKPLPGMTEFYRLLRNDPKNPVPLIFISASPHFFRRSFQALFHHHEIDYTGLSLKPFMTLFEFLLRRYIRSQSSPEEILSGYVIRLVESFQKLKKGNLKKKLSNQVAYKLVIMLENRLMQPSAAKEILLGDNTESDYFIFALYQVLLSGTIKPERLESYLSTLQFQERDPMTEEQVIRIRQLTLENLAIHGAINPVKGAWINRAYPDPDPREMDKTIRTYLPVDSGYGDDISPIILCHGALGFTLASIDAGLMSLDDLQKIKKVVMGQRIMLENWDDQLLKKVTREFPFKKENLRKKILKSV